jgi:hypothetical protein
LSVVRAWGGGESTVEWVVGAEVVFCCIIGCSNQYNSRCKRLSTLLNFGFFVFIVKTLGTTVGGKK